MCLRVVLSHVTLFTFLGTFQWLLIVNYNFKKTIFALYFVSEAFAVFYYFKIWSSTFLGLSFSVSV